MNFCRNSFAGAGEPLGGQPDGGVDLGDEAGKEKEENPKHFQTAKATL